MRGIPRPLREIRFQIGDLRAPGGEVDGEIGLGRFQRMQQTLRGGKILALRLAFAFRGGQFFLDVADLVAQFTVGGARIVEHRLQADLFGLFGFEIAQRLADRIDQFADRALDGVELIDLAVGVEQQIAQCLVLAAELGAERGEQFLVEFERVIAWGCWLVRLFGGARLAGEKAKSAHDRADSSLKGNTISPHWKGWCDGRRLHTTDGCDSSLKGNTILSNVVRWCFLSNLNPPYI